MSHAIAFASLKGGVGKTTLALNCAYAFAKRGTRTLLVDTDPQGSIGLSLDGVGEKAGFAAAVRNGTPFTNSVIKTRLAELDLLPMGPISMMDLDGFPAEVRSRKALPRLLEETGRGYDMVLLDTAAGLGGMTRLVLESVNSVVAVAQCEPLSLRALPRFLELLAGLRESGSRVSLLGVAGNMSSFRDPVVLASLEEVWALYRDDVFDTAIPRDPMFLQASRAGVPLGLLSRRPPAIAAVFDKLVAEMEERLGIADGGDNDGPIRLVD